jgi:hypothetical protein
MTAKEYLQRYLEANREIDAKLIQAHALRDMATQTTSALDVDHVQGGDADKVGRIVAKIVDIERTVDEGIDKLQGVKAEVEGVIDAVDNPRLRNLLRYRYISGLTFEDISVRTDRCWRQTIRLHGYALQAVEIVLKGTK